MSSAPASPSHCPFCGAALAGEPICAGCGRRPIDSRVGMTLSGKFRIDAIISQGGIGRVYKATHLTLGSPVVIKFLLARWAAEQEWRARFKREAVALARLRHPGIVTIHDFGEHEGTLYIVMEYLDGKPLSALVQVGGRTMPLSRIGNLTDQILQVLEASHGAGIVHRDMKPENVMVLPAPEQETERVKVLDFGIALVSDGDKGERLTAPGMTRGTPHYMSPEQCRGERVGAPTDIYALGVILYELLAGALPFSGQSNMELMAQHIYVEPPPISERGLRNQVPPAMEALVRRTLAKRADERPTAVELRDSLKEAIQSSEGWVESFTTRARMATLPREQRGLGARPLPTQPVSPLADGKESPRVLIWGNLGERAESLRCALGVIGLLASIRSQDTPPLDVDLDGNSGTSEERIRAVLVWGIDKAERLQRIAALRAVHPARKLPLLVLDVAGTEEVSACIRAGASDVSLKNAAESSIGRQLVRLIQRGR